MLRLPIDPQETVYIFLTTEDTESTERIQNSFSVSSVFSAVKIFLARGFLEVRRESAFYHFRGRVVNDAAFAKGLYSRS